MIKEIGCYILDNDESAISKLKSYIDLTPGLILRGSSTNPYSTLKELLNSCKKEEGKPKELEFQYLATKDVQWKFHFQGRHDSTNNLDTSYHRYVTAKPTGDTEMPNHYYRSF